MVLEILNGIATVGGIVSTIGGIINSIDDNNVSSSNVIKENDNHDRPEYLPCNVSINVQSINVDSINVWNDKSCRDAFSFVN